MHRDADRTTFEEVFSPLAHHLFPDGCPKDDFESTNTTISISKCWPRRCDRSIVSLKDAIQSISNIHQYSQRNGCYPHELLQLCIVACATLCSEEKLPLQSRGGGRSSAAVSHSGLMDGTSYYFIRILQCMVPSGSCTDLECVPSEILRKLLSVASSNKCDTDGKCAVLRFLVRPTDQNKIDTTDLKDPRKKKNNIHHQIINFLSFLSLYSFSPCYTHSLPKDISGSKRMPKIFQQGNTGGIVLLFHTFLYDIERGDCG